MNNNEPVQASNGYQQIFYEFNWKLAFKTRYGIVGLASDEDSLYLGFPHEIAFLLREFSDKTVKKIANRHYYGACIISKEERTGLAETRELLIEMDEEQLVKLCAQCNVVVPEWEDKVTITEQDIMQTLGVERSERVVYVERKKCLKFESCKLNDIRLEIDADGSNWCYRMLGQRQWAKYWGPRFQEDQGRVWIDYSDNALNSCDFFVILENSLKGLTVVQYGSIDSRSIYSIDRSYWNKYAPDSPTNDPEAIQQYRDKFIALACRIVQDLGGASSVTIEYGNKLFLRQLAELGFGEVEWLNSQNKKFVGLARAKKQIPTGLEIVVLKVQNNQDLPWTTYRRVPIVGDLTVEGVHELLTF